MAQALPELHLIQITVDHPIFQSFFDIKKLDVPHPSVNVMPGYMAMFENNDPSRPDDRARQLEQRPGGVLGMVGGRALLRDPTNDAYRLGVNYIVYAMTH